MPMSRRTIGVTAGLLAALVQLITLWSAKSTAAPSPVNARPAASADWPQAEDAAATFLRHLRLGAFDKAYAMTAPELGAKFTPAQFRSTLATFQEVGLQRVTWSAPLRTSHKFMDVHPVKGLRWNVYEREFTGDLVTARGGTVTVHFAWINEDGLWRLTNLRWEAAKR